MPSQINPALILVGPCLLQSRGQTFYSKGNITLTPKLETFNIENARYGVIEEREKDLTYELAFTPVGDLAALSVLWPYGAATPGELLHATATVTAINTGTETLTTTSLARFREGAAVRIASSLTVPAGLAADTLYFLHKVTSTSATLHTTEADAIAATGAVNITGAGTGRIRLIEQETTVVHTFDGEKYTFHNSIVVQSPDMELSAERTVIGEVRIEAFRRFGIASTDAASFYTKTTTGVTDTTFDPADIVTESATFAWGATAPWSDMPTKTGISAKFPLTLDPVGDDASGITSRRLTALACTVSARPLNLEADDIHTALVAQGAGAGRGRRLDSTKALNAYTASIYLRLYGAMLKPGALNHDTKEERVGELTWTAARVFAAGVASPLYYVGAGAPA